jgi:ferrous iron transport protein B
MKTFALVGLPNSGKSFLFNTLTGSRQKIANYAGVTLEKKEGFIEKSLSLIDLPGLYGLNPHSVEEKVADYFLKRDKNKIFLLFTLDCTRLRKSLSLLLQLKNEGFSIVVTPTMLDLAAKRGQILDFAVLQKEIEIPVIFPKELKNFLILYESTQQLDESSISFETAFKQAFVLAKKITLKPLEKDLLTDSLDNIILDPLWGILSLLGILFLFFQTLFFWIKPLDTIISESISFLQSQLNFSYVPLENFLNQGVLEGIKIICTFIPYLFFLSFFLLVLEQSGYLTRIAFLLESFMRFLNLPGKSFISILTGHACAIPALISTRAIENPFQRTITLLMIPFTSCSARLPLYTLLSKSLFDKALYQGLCLFFLYFFGILGAFFTAFMLKVFSKKQTFIHSIMEFPQYHIPHFRNIFLEVLRQCLDFFQKVGVMILISSCILWFLSFFPQGSEVSYLMKISQSISIVFKPLGYDWKITTALLTSLSAREMMLPSLAFFFGGEGKFLSAELSQAYSYATRLSLLIFFVFAPLCFSTYSTIYRETKNMTTSIGIFLYSFFLSYLLALGVYQCFSVQ